MNARRVRRSCHTSLHFPPSAVRPRCAPIASRSLPPAAHNLASHTPLLQAPAAHAGPASRSPSTVTIPDAHRPQEPCTPAASLTTTPSIPQLLHPAPCSRPPTSSLLPPPSPPPLHLSPPAGSPIWPRSLPTRFGTHGF